MRIIEISFILLVFSQSVFCIKCYSCTSHKDPDCELSPPPEKYLIECTTHTLEVYGDVERQSKLDEDSNQNKATLQKNSGTMSANAQEPNSNAFPNQPFQQTTAPSNQNLSEPAGLQEKVSRPVRSVENSANKSFGFTPELLKMPKEATMCRKSVYYIPEQANGPDSVLPSTVRVTRSCGWITEDEKESQTVESKPIRSLSTCKWIGAEAVQYDQCVCTRDGCNAGGYLESLKLQTTILFAVMTAGYCYIL